MDFIKYGVILCVFFVPSLLLGQRTAPHGAQLADPPSLCDAVSGNLVQNCGFEAGSGGVGNFSPGWTFIPAAAGSDSGVAMDNPHSGVQDAFFGAMNPGVYDSIQQTIPTTAGEAYTFSFYLYTDGAPRDFQAYYDGQLIYDNAAPGTDVYTQQSFTVIGTGSDTITFKGFNSNSFDNLDDVLFVASPNTALNFSGSGTEDAFQITYISQLNNADSVINISNAGTVAGAVPLNGIGVAAGNLCVNIYVYAPDQQQVACCSCLVTHNELIYLNAGGPTESRSTSWGIPTNEGGNGVPGFLWNTTYGAGLYPFNSAVVKLVATNPNSAIGCNNTPRDPVHSTPASVTAAVITGADLAPGMTVWTTHSHPTNGATTPGPGGTPLLPVSVTETEGQSSRLSFGELSGLTSLCNTIVQNGNGAGQCTCPAENQAGGFVKPH